VTARLDLRDAVPGDEVVLDRFIRDLASYEHLLHEVRGTAEDLRRALFDAPPRCHAMLAEIDGQPVGFALWFYTFSTFAGRPGMYVEDVFVAKAHRGRGIGRTLFRALARRARDEGCARLDWAVLNWNAPAIGFYRSIGARPLDEWTGQRLEGDALASFAD
jgi:GNAT superfamily N-acetyltransferase